jgi:hypothetical protein
VTVWIQYLKAIGCYGTRSNNTLIGRSNLTTTGNLSVENIKEDNNTDEAEPIGGIK